MHGMTHIFITNIIWQMKLIATTTAKKCMSSNPPSLESTKLLAIISKDTPMQQE